MSTTKITCPICGEHENLHTPYAGEFWNNAYSVDDVTPGMEIVISCADCEEDFHMNEDGELEL